MSTPSNVSQPSSMLSFNSDSSHRLQSRVERMKAMVEKYSLHLPRHEPKTAGSTSYAGITVVVTGTTGALGCYILDSLVKNPGITHVYAFNRPGNGTQGILERQKAGLIERGLDTECVLSSAKVDVLEADVNVPGFGIPSDIYEKILHSTTHIIHNAWPVVFNRSLAKFEDNVKGLRNLIDFSLSSPREEPIKFVYVSSIGVFQNSSVEVLGTNIPEDASPLVEAAASNGYTGSKWVSEQILANAAKDSNLKALVVRVGQLSGGINGCWNGDEWFPATVKWSIVLRCFPSDHNRITSWIPVNLAAHAMVDYLGADFKSYTAIHLTHPNPVPWNVIARSVSREISVPLVPFSEWRTKMEQFVQERQNDTAVLGLVPFLTKVLWMYDYSKVEFCYPSFQNILGVSLSSTLSDPAIVGCLSESDVRSWIGYWRRKGLLRDFKAKAVL